MLLQLFVAAAKEPEPSAAAWVHNVPSPFEPMSLAVSLEADVLVYGARDCPDNTANELALLSLGTGGVLRRVGSDAGGVSQMSAGGGKGELTVAGVGWRKDAGKTVLSALHGNASHGHVHTTTVSGDPAMWTTAATAGNGQVSAVLWEPEPDQRHINNRSGELLVFKADPSAPLFRAAVPGLGEADPQTVAISSTGPTYTVAAVMGFRTMVWDVTLEGTHTLVYSKESPDDSVGPEPAIAVSPTGTAFAVSHGPAVSVFCRESAGGTEWTKAAELKAPDQAKYVDLGPIAMAWSTRAEAKTLLAVGWSGSQGDAVAVSAHPMTDKGPAGDGWSHAKGCDPSSPYFDDLVADGLAVSPRGEYVALGSWGCGPTDSNFLVFQGLDGQGQPALATTSPGQIWAVAVDATANGTAVAAYGSWSALKDKSVKAQVAAFRL